MTGIRFNPPATPVSSETAWALLRALGPRDAAIGADRDAEIAENRAVRLGLAERIWSRWRDDPDRAGISPEAAGRFERAFRRSVATGLMYEEVAAELASVAAELGVPLVFLKGYALGLSGVQAPGSRPYSDLDVLAGEKGARALARALGARGWRSPAIAENEQHLPALCSPLGGVVEIHFRLRGVQVAASPWADAAELASAGGLRPAESHPGDCSLLNRDLQAAHLLAHGIEQHGHRPHTYPLLRMIGDLADLLPDEAVRRDFAARHRPTLAGAVSEEETLAALDLVDRLTHGELPEPVPGAAGNAERLLRHLVAGSLDEDYASSLAPGHLASRLRTAVRRGHLGVYLKRKLRPVGNGAATEHSTARSTLGRLGSGILRMLRAAAGRLRRKR